MRARAFTRAVHLSVDKKINRLVMNVSKSFSRQNIAFESDAILSIRIAARRRSSLRQLTAVKDNLVYSLVSHIKDGFETLIRN